MKSWNYLLFLIHPLHSTPVHFARFLTLGWFGFWTSTKIWERVGEEISNRCRMWRSRRRNQRTTRLPYQLLNSPVAWLVWGGKYPSNRFCADGARHLWSWWFLEGGEGVAGLVEPSVLVSLVAASDTSWYLDVRQGVAAWCLLESQQTNEYNIMIRYDN